MDRPPSETGDTPPVVHVSVGEERRCGQYVDLRGADVDPGAVAAAVRGRGGAVEIRAPAPGRPFEYFGVIGPDRTLDLQAALAAVARRRGHESSRASELAAVRAELDALSASEHDAADARRAVARAGDAEAELAERVATLRGTLRARRESGAGVDDVADALESAVAELAEVRTERIAAEQRLGRARERGRAVRDRRERRLELQDRERNLERAVRRDLADAAYPAFVEAAGEVPGEARPGASVVEYDGDDATAALALARMTASPAPVVLAVDRFASPAAAARRLGRPVLRV